MGSTGAGIFKTSNKGAFDVREIGIRGAVNFTGRLPAESDMEQPGNSKLTFRIQSSDNKDIIFQFKLLSNNEMSIRAYDPNIPSKGKVAVSVKTPSLDSAINSSDRKTRINAQKIRSMMNKSAKIDESMLSQIANRLKMAKNRKGN